MKRYWGYGTVGSELEGVLKNKDVINQRAGDEISHVCSGSGEISREIRYRKR